MDFRPADKMFLTSKSQTRRKRERERERERENGVHDISAADDRWTFHHAARSVIQRGTLIVIPTSQNYKIWITKLNSAPWSFHIAFIFTVVYRYLSKEYRGYVWIFRRTIFSCLAVSCSRSRSRSRIIKMGWSCGVFLIILRATREEL